MRSFISGEQRSKNELNLWEQRQCLGTGNIGNQDCDFGKQGNKVIYFMGTWEQVPAGRASSYITVLL